MNDKKQKGLLILTEKFEKMVKKRNQDSFLILKRIFMPENPWKIEAIRKLTIHPVCSIQTVFWKIRLLKDIGNENISLQNKMKLNKLINVFEKRKTKILYFSFSKVDTGRITPDNIMNLSFNLPFPQNRSSSRPSFK